MADAINSILLEQPGRKWVVDYGKLWQIVLKNPREVLIPEHIIPGMANPTAYVIAADPFAAKMLGIHIWCIYNPEELDPQPDIDCFLLTQAVFVPEEHVIIGTHVVQSWADHDPSQIVVSPFNLTSIIVKGL